MKLLFTILVPVLITSPGYAADFVKIPRGSFQMGSPNSEANRSDGETLHTVTISHDFEMAVTDTTQLQWFDVMGNNPSYFKSQQYCQSDYISMNGTDLCPNNPVEQVSWDDAQAFIAKLNKGNDGYTYRLPTEAEWEYAAPAGTQTAYYFGDDATQLDAMVGTIITPVNRPTLLAAKRRMPSASTTWLETCMSGRRIGTVLTVTLG